MARGRAGARSNLRRLLAYAVVVIVAPGAMAGDATRGFAADESRVPAGEPFPIGLAQHVSPSCSGRGADGHRVQVLYVREADHPSRFTAVADELTHHVAGIDDVFAVSGRATEGGRRVRWVHDARCRPVLREVVLADGTLGDSLAATADALAEEGFDAGDRKYLVFADNADSGFAASACGRSTLFYDDSADQNLNDGGQPGYARVDVDCWDNHVPAHELVHVLGGVQDSAPDGTAGSHCSDGWDLMCPPADESVPRCPDRYRFLLDCGNDDYFHTDPAPGSYLAHHWNVARSRYLDVVEPLPPL